jgi:hypothetical protein
MPAVDRKSAVRHDHGRAGVDGEFLKARHGLCVYGFQSRAPAIAAPLESLTTPEMVAVPS